MMTEPSGTQSSSPRRLGLAVLIAAAVAALVLVVTVLPAEYGIDPIGIGVRLGPIAAP